MKKFLFFTVLFQPSRTGIAADIDPDTVNFKNLGELIYELEHESPIP